MIILDRCHPERPRVRREEAEGSMAVIGKRRFLGFARNDRRAGFTLVELLVSISILAGMTIISAQKFRLIQQDGTLTAGAMRIADTLRRAQTLSQSGTIIDPDYSRAVGFGVHFEKADSTAGTVGSALVFADVNTSPPAPALPFSEKGMWNGDIADANDLKDAQIGNDVSPDVPGTKEVVIDSIESGADTLERVDIAFLTPDAAGRIDAGIERDSVVITLKNVRTNRTKKIGYNRVSGRIDIN